ncbi:hypothetical protein FHT32_004721 [Variovorax sp. SG517]|uniref:hypothetical protein n=1 Tax=Variovorax sp. SG517 TaxID=2587117 RepID=UPI00159D07CE|nr:hypothetical protein [Variovorax sp. SG517]NVM91057.1 hypothetical protein [Variovorax sp. SG517]
MNEITEHRYLESLRDEAQRRFAKDLERWEASGARQVEMVSPSFKVERRRDGKIVGDVEYVLILPNEKTKTHSATLVYSEATPSQEGGWYPTYVSWHFN